MARKPREFKCIFCGAIFTTQQPTAKYCSMGCRTHGKGLSIWTEVESSCIVCGKEYVTKKNEDGKLQKQFCSNSCQSVYVNKNYGNGMNEEVKKKISDKLTGVSLRERGYKEESISAWVQAGQVASILVCKDKKLEEIVGDDKAKEIKAVYSQQRSGDGNSQSLLSISKRFNCSLDEAAKLTTCYNRVGNKHPMFGKHHTIESKQKIIDNHEKALTVIQGYFNKIKWQGSWELEFLINCYEEKVDVRRYDLPPIEYKYKNITHHTWPDFIIDDTYIVEVKGWANEKSKLRIEACEQYFGDDFIVIDSVKKRRETSSLQWINKQVEKYSYLIEIVNIPKNIKVGV